MRRAILICGLAALIAAPLLASPGSASASCSSRKTTGTILGGVGGALIGNSISGGGGGAIIGGLGGAVVGHEIGRGGCRRERASAYYNGGSGVHARPSPTAASYIYYDQYGRPISAGPGGAPAYAPASYACRTETRSYYDARGGLIQRPAQVCDR